MVLLNFVYCVIRNHKSCDEGMTEELITRSTLSVWVLDYAAKGLHHDIIKEILKHRPHTLYDDQHASFTRLCSAFIHHCIMQQDYPAFPVAVRVLDLLYRKCPESVDFSLYAQLSVGLKKLILLNDLVDSDGSTFNLFLHLHHYFPRKPENVLGLRPADYERLVKLQFEFREILVPMIKKRTEGHTYRQTDFSKVFGPNFIKTLLDLAYRCHNEINSHLPSTVIEKIIKEGTEKYRPLEKFSSRAFKMLLSTIEEKVSSSTDRESSCIASLSSTDLQCLVRAVFALQYSLRNSSSNLNSGDLGSKTSQLQGRSVPRSCQSQCKNAGDKGSDQDACTGIGQKGDGVERQAVLTSIKDKVPSVHNIRINESLQVHWNTGTTISKVNEQKCLSSDCHTSGQNISSSLVEKENEDPDLGSTECRNQDVSLLREVFSNNSNEKEQENGDEDNTVTSKLKKNGSICSIGRNDGLHFQNNCQKASLSDKKGCRQLKNGVGNFCLNSYHNAVRYSSLTDLSEDSDLERFDEEDIEQIFEEGSMKKIGTMIACQEGSASDVDNMSDSFEMVPPSDTEDLQLLEVLYDADDKVTDIDFLPDITKHLKSSQSKNCIVKLYTSMEHIEDGKNFNIYA